MKFINLFFLAIALFVSHSGIAQTSKKIKVKKENSRNVLFYPKGKVSDTIVEDVNDLFYLSVSDSSKSDLVIQIDNGQLKSAGEDDLYKLTLIKGISYESSFIQRNYPDETGAMHLRYEFNTVVNGVPAEANNQVVIKMKLKGSDNFFLETKYLFQAKK